MNIVYFSFDFVGGVKFILFCVPLSFTIESHVLIYYMVENCLILTDIEFE